MAYGHRCHHWTCSQVQGWPADCVVKFCMGVQFVDYNDCEAAKALAEILTDMKDMSFITKDTANQLYSNGLEVRTQKSDESHIL